VGQRNHVLGMGPDAPDPPRRRGHIGVGHSSDKCESYGIFGVSQSCSYWVTAAMRPVAVSTAATCLQIQY